MMRASEGPLTESAHVETGSAYGRDRGNLQRLGLRERRKKPSKPLGEHALSRPWRPDHQQTMFASSGDDECTLWKKLPSHVAQVEAAACAWRRMSVPCQSALRAALRRHHRRGCCQ